MYCVVACGAPHAQPHNRNDTTWQGTRTSLRAANDWAWLGWARVACHSHGQPASRNHLTQSKLYHPKCYYDQGPHHHVSDKMPMDIASLLTPRPLVEYDRDPAKAQCLIALTCFYVLCEALGSAGSAASSLCLCAWCLEPYFAI